MVIHLRLPPCAGIKGMSYHVLPCMDVLPAFMPVCYMHPVTEEARRKPGTVVTDDYDLSFRELGI